MILINMHLDWISITSSESELRTLFVAFWDVTSGREGARWQMDVTDHRARGVQMTKDPSVLCFHIKYYVHATLPILQHGNPIVLTLIAHKRVPTAVPR